MATLKITKNVCLEGFNGVLAFTADRQKFVILLTANYFGILRLTVNSIEILCLLYNKPMSGLVFSLFWLSSVAFCDCITDIVKKSRI